MEPIILSDEPKIQVYHEVLTKELCALLIELASKEERRSKLVDYEGRQFLDEQITDQMLSSYSGADLTQAVETAVQTICSALHLDKSRLEVPQLRHYKEGSEFKFHHDYLSYELTENTDKVTRDLITKGGNRISTLIFYLNDDFSGGETYFPWLEKAVTPKTGSCVRFDYGYDDYMLNVFTDHRGMPVDKGEKWIMTIFIHEADTAVTMENFKKYTREREFYSDIQDAIFELECGPEYDRRTLKVELQANNDPSNTILLGMTGGMESTLLLYILAALNETQKIPYKIQPIGINFVNIFDESVTMPQHEVGIGIPQIVNWVKEKTNSRHIKPMWTWRMRTIEEGQKLGFAVGLEQVLEYHKYLHLYDEDRPMYRQYFKYMQMKVAYTGQNELPPLDGSGLITRPVQRIPNQNPRILSPFQNLLKYHIIDAILQLGLEELFGVIMKCKVNHVKLEEPCHNLWQCEERRWGFQKLGLSELGYKYFCNLYK